MDFENIEKALVGSGLSVRGGFYPETEDAVPDTLAGGGATVVLVGNAGSEMWAAFATATTPALRYDEANPLDNWTRDILDKAAGVLGCRALYPFTGPPYLPFQQWALRAGEVFMSPIGPLIHPVFGLWHAYRGALVFSERLPLPDPQPSTSPCETCRDKPCLAACPADVFASGQYDVPACVGHVDSTAGKECRTAGCLARRACPVGLQYAYGPEQARFHMEKFLKAQV